MMSGAEFSCRAFVIAFGEEGGMEGRREREEATEEGRERERRKEREGKGKKWKKVESERERVSMHLKNTADHISMATLTRLRPRMNDGEIEESEL